jgi:hypothetical protein
VHLKLVIPSDDGRVMERPENDGFVPSGEILVLLERLADHSSEVVVSDALTDYERSRFYLDAAAAANRQHPKVKVGRPFGSNRHPGSDFGVAVPGLVVYEEEDGLPADVYPHEGSDGKIETIREYLVRLGPQAV